MDDPSGAPTRAVILAAGCGLRLGRETDQLPKCLLSLGSETILEFQLRALTWAGVREVALVTGYRAECIRERAAGRSVCYFHNEHYRSTNSLSSFFCAREFAEPGALVINSDVVFHPLLLRQLLDSPHPNALLFDPRRPLGEEEMKVAVDGTGVVAHLSKAMVAADAAGENVGIVRLGAGTAGKALEAAGTQPPERLSRLWFPEAINLLRPILPFQAVEVGNTPWTEIDFPDDLQVARHDVYPKCADALRQLEAGQSVV